MSINEKPSLFYLASNFNELCTEKIDTAPYAGYQIRFSFEELKLIQEVRQYLTRAHEAAMRGGAATTDAKKAAARLNGKKGGRPRKIIEESA